MSRFRSIKPITLSVAMILGLLVNAQEELSFGDALAKTLENNYDIRISRIDEEIAGNNASRSATGYIPQLSASGGYNWTFFEGNNQLRVGEDIAFNANSSYNYNAGITASFLLFDGFGRKYRYEQAKGNENLSALELKGIMENVILQLSQTFHEVARLQQQTRSLDSTLSISSQRLLRAEYGNEFGQSTQLDILNAQVDLNADSINLLNSRLLEANTKRSLNLLMGEPISSDYEIKEDVQLRTIMSSELVVNSALSNGNRVKTAEQINRNAHATIQANRSAWYPNFNISGGYQYRGSDDPNGAFVIGNSVYGPTAGVSMSWNIFNGSNNTQVENARLQLKSSELSLELTQEQTRADALNAHGTYQNAIYVLQASEKTVETARYNFTRTEESYKLGQITSVEFRVAQLNLLSAELQLSQALYNAKNAELNLLALMGILIE